MTNPRDDAHRLIDRLPETQLSALVGLLETIVDPVATALRNVAADDDPRRKKKSRPWRKPASGSSGTAARAFRTRKRCGGWAWSEGRSSGPGRHWKTWPRSIRVSPPRQAGGRTLRRYRRWRRETAPAYRPTRNRRRAGDYRVRFHLEDETVQVLRVPPPDGAPASLAARLATE